jgi:hypothetical protein
MLSSLLLSQSGLHANTKPLCTHTNSLTALQFVNSITLCTPTARVPCCCLGCRLFAVGYAMRQTSSGQQLIHLMSNPPVPWGLQFLPSEWVLSMPAKAGGTCAFCQDSLSKEVGAQAVAPMSVCV